MVLAVGFNPRSVVNEDRVASATPEKRQPSLRDGISRHRSPALKRRARIKSRYAASASCVLASAGNAFTRLKKDASRIYNRDDGSPRAGKHTRIKFIASAGTRTLYSCQSPVRGRTKNENQRKSRKSALGGCDTLRRAPHTRTNIGRHAIPAVREPAPAAGSNRKDSPEQLDSLVAPIALYPDPLLAQPWRPRPILWRSFSCSNGWSETQILRIKALADAVAKGTGTRVSRQWRHCRDGQAPSK